MRPLRALGRVSYGVYLWHFPVFLAVVHAWPDGPSAMVVPGSLAITAIAVVASWNLVERPVLDWSRARQARRGPAAAPAVATSAAA